MGSKLPRVALSGSERAAKSATPRPGGGFKVYRSGYAKIPSATGLKKPAEQRKEMLARKRQAATHKLDCDRKTSTLAQWTHERTNSREMAIQDLVCLKRRSHCKRVGAYCKNALQQHQPPAFPPRQRRAHHGSVALRPSLTPAVRCLPRVRPASAFVPQRPAGRNSADPIPM